MKQATDSALLTDLYQLTMLQAYHDEGLDGKAVFELFVRALPAQRNFLLLAGIEQALDFLQQLRTVKVVRCDEPGLRILGLTLANWNAVVSAALAFLATLGARGAGAPRR